MRKRSRVATVVLVALVLVSHLSHAAFAGFIDRTDSPSMSVSTASLAAPTGLAAATGCVLLAPNVTLTWTATSSTYASGYRVYRRTATGSFAQIGTATGASATSYADSTVVGGQSYVYVIHAYYENWTAGSNETSVSVPLVCV